MPHVASPRSPRATSRERGLEALLRRDGGVKVEGGPGSPRALSAFGKSQPPPQSTQSFEADQAQKRRAHLNRFLKGMMVSGQVVKDDSAFTEGSIFVRAKS
eukprot:g22631.t1